MWSSNVPNVNKGYSGILFQFFLSASHLCNFSHTAVSSQCENGPVVNLYWNYLDTRRMGYHSAEECWLTEYRQVFVKLSRPWNVGERCGHSRLCVCVCECVLSRARKLQLNQWEPKEISVPHLQKIKANCNDITKWKCLLFLRSRMNSHAESEWENCVWRCLHVLLSCLRWAIPYNSEN